MEQYRIVYILIDSAHELTFIVIVSKIKKLIKKLLNLRKALKRKDCSVV